MNKNKRIFKILLESSNTASFTGAPYNASYNIDWTMTMIFKITYIDNTPQNTFSSILKNL